MKNYGLWRKIGLPLAATVAMGMYADSADAQRVKATPRHTYVSGAPAGARTMALPRVSAIPGVGTVPRNSIPFGSSPNYNAERARPLRGLAGQRGLDSRPGYSGLPRVQPRTGAPVREVNGVQYFDPHPGRSARAKQLRGGLNGVNDNGAVLNGNGSFDRVYNGTNNTGGRGGNTASANPAWHRNDRHFHHHHHHDRSFSIFLGFSTAGAFGVFGFGTGFWPWWAPPVVVIDYIRARELAWHCRLHGDYHPFDGSYRADFEKQHRELIEKYDIVAREMKEVHEEVDEVGKRLDEHIRRGEPTPQPPAAQPQAGAVEIVEVLPRTYVAEYDEVCDVQGQLAPLLTRYLNSYVFPLAEEAGMGNGEGRLWARYNAGRQVLEVRDSKDKPVGGIDLKEYRKASRVSARKAFADTNSVLGDPMFGIDTEELRIRPDGPNATVEYQFHGCRR